MSDTAAPMVTNGQLLTGQPELFDAEELVDARFVKELVDYAHTGKALLNRPEELAAIIVDLRSGASLRDVSRKFRRGRKTIRAAVDELEKAGKLAPLEKRISSKLGYAIELCVDNAIELLENRAVPANVIPIMAGVFSDKKALLDGKPTAIVETRDKGLNIEALNDLVDRLPEAQVISVRDATPDSESGEKGAHGGE